jgi:hypothetical protein
MGGRSIPLALLLGAAMVFGSVSPAGAAVTLGSDLSQNPVNAACTGSCTIANQALPGRQIDSPVDGLIVRWRVRNENVGTAARLRVLQLMGAFTYLGINSSDTQTLPSPGSGNFVTTAYPTQQPIRTGQFIGLDLDAPNTNNIGIETNPVPGAVRLRWEPQIPDDGSTITTFSANTEFTFNADVEPELTTITGHPNPKVKTRKKKARVTFAFASNQSGLGFECSIDGAAFAACSSPVSFKARRGPHSFAIEATLNGLKFGDPASYDFKVKRKKRR